MKPALLLLLAVPVCRAHEYPIAPVRVVLKVEPGRVVADVAADSVYWLEEIVAPARLSGGPWPKEALEKSEAYVNRHLRLCADGTKLPGRLVSARYAQRPWQVNEEGLVRLRLVYPAADGAERLAGEADFFGEYLAERLENKEPILPNQDFRTVLSIPGRVPAALTLRPDAKSFAAGLRQARRTRLQRLAESLSTGFSSVLGLAPGWPALAALALSLGPGVPARARAAAAAAGVFFGAVLPAPAPAWLVWTAGLLAAGAAGRWPAAAASWLEPLAAAALGRAWFAEAAPLLPGAQPGFGELVLACAGVLAGAALLGALGLGAAEAERRRLADFSESGGAALFERRRALAATALLIASAWGLARAAGAGAA